ncbi:MAG: TetR/AcrR family transcriptional regulator [Acidimicrobiales bacterium]
MRNDIEPPVGAANAPESSDPDEGAGDGSHPAPRQRLTREARREQLLDVAAQLIQESGLGVITMERVAQRAGVSKGMPYRHFANADALIVELFRREVVDRRNEVREALEDNPDRSSEAGFRAFFSEWIKENYVLLDLLTQTTSVSGPLREAQDAYANQSEQYFATLYQRRLGLSETSAKIAANFVLAALRGSVRSWERGHGSEEDIERVAVAMIDGGLRNLLKQERQRGATGSHEQSQDAEGRAEGPSA